MERVTGIGGIFFKSADPKALGEWYGRTLGIEFSPGSGAMFRWRPVNDAAPEGGGAGGEAEEAMTVWCPFPADTKYFGPGPSPFMINYRVANLDAILAQLREAGAQVEPVQEAEYGRFAWATDPDGNRFELWEPPAEQ